MAFLRNNRYKQVEQQNLDEQKEKQEIKTLENRIIQGNKKIMELSKSLAEKKDTLNRIGYDIDLNQSWKAAAERRSGDDSAEGEAAKTQISRYTRALQDLFVGQTKTQNEIAKISESIRFFTELQTGLVKSLEELQKPGSYKPPSL